MLTFRVTTQASINASFKPLIIGRYGPNVGETDLLDNNNNNNNSRDAVVKVRECSGEGGQAVVRVDRQ